MSAYIIVQVEIKDPEGFQTYREMVQATLDRYQGQFLVRGGRVENLEGSWEPPRLCRPRDAPLVSGSR